MIKYRRKRVYYFVFICAETLIFIVKRHRNGFLQNLIAFFFGSIYHLPLICTIMEKKSIIWETRRGHRVQLLHVQVDTPSTTPLLVNRLRHKLGHVMPLVKTRCNLKQELPRIIRVKGRRFFFFFESKSCLCVFRYFVISVESVDIS